MSISSDAYPVPPLDVLHPAIVVGQVGEAQMIDGWHERETDGRNGVPYRASHAVGRLVLRATEGVRAVSVLLAAPVSLHGRPIEGRFVCNKVKYALPLGVNTWVLRTFPIETSDSVLRIRLELKAPVVPDAVLKNGDSRALGWFLSAIWQT